MTDTPPAPATPSTPPTPLVQVDADALGRAPVDILAGLVVFVAAVAALLLAIALGLATLGAIVALVVWLVTSPWRFVAAVALPGLFALVWIWLGAAHVSVSALEGLGVRTRGAAVYGCLAAAPLLAPTLGPLAFLRSLGRGVTGRRVLALLAALLLVGVGIAIGRATAGPPA